MAEGQRIFIHTGLLQQAKTPNEVIGVLAHETGHIAGGHLSRMNNELGKASNMAIASALLGAAAMVGAAMTGNSAAAQGGQALMMGGQSMAQRSLLAYARAQEASADQAAATFLGKTGQSGKGMLDLFQTLANQSIASTRFVSPYVLTHPMPLERIRNLDQIVKTSPYYDKPDPPALVLRHQLMQAKLFGFLNADPGGLSEISGERSLAPRPLCPLDRRLPHRRPPECAAGDRRFDSRGAERPVFLGIEGPGAARGRPPGRGHRTDQKGRAAPAQQRLDQSPAGPGAGRDGAARGRQGRTSRAQGGAARRAGHVAGSPPAGAGAGAAGNFALAELSTAEGAALKGDKKLATEKAQRALKSFAEGSPEWLKANDILNYTKKDR